MTIRRIEAGLLGNMTDMDRSITPFAAGLSVFIDMEKGDFVGKAALLDADRRPLLFGLKCADATPTMGSVVMDGDQIVGYMTAGTHSPTLDCGIGYVRFEQPGAWAGRTLQLRFADGNVRQCEIVNIPFVDHMKRIVRGLDKTIP